MNSKIYPEGKAENQQTRVELPDCISSEENEPVLTVKRYVESPFQFDNSKKESQQANAKVHPENQTSYYIPEALQKEITVCGLVEAKLEKNINDFGEPNEEEYYEGKQYFGYKCGFGTCHKIRRVNNITYHEYYQGQFTVNYYHGLGTLIKCVEKDGTIENIKSETFEYFKNIPKTECFKFIKNFNDGIKIKREYPENKAVYCGDFVGDQRQGIGKYTWPDGTYFIGCFDDDKFNGFGSMRYANGNKYKGEWKDGKMHGFGQFIWKNKEKYLGHYIENQKQGFGVYTWHDDVQYYGNFCDNKQDGTAFLKSKGGQTLTSVWNMGKRIYRKGENIIQIM